MLRLVMDTNCLGDFLIQYFGISDHGRSNFERIGNITGEFARALNQIRLRYQTGDGGGSLVIASALAFVELAQHWDDMVGKVLRPYQLATFLEQPPDWFDIAPFDHEVVPAFCRVPTDVEMPGGHIVPIEWADAIHVATAIIRDEQDLCRFVTTDGKLLNLDMVRSRLLEK